MTAPDSIMPPCPRWCTLTPGHPWDGAGAAFARTADETECRGHIGPKFGEFVHIEGYEFASNPGALHLAAWVSERTEMLANPAEARDLGDNLRRAARWIEEQPYPWPAEVRAATAEHNSAAVATHDRPCPHWCTLSPGHGGHLDADGGNALGHSGPKFGPFVIVEGLEYPHTPGLVFTHLWISPDVESDVRQPTDAQALIDDLQHAMLWIEDSRAECHVPLSPCPAWCTLPATHGWDGYTADGTQPEHWRRSHQGPHFGEYVSIDGEEYAHEPGIVQFQVGVDGVAEQNIVTAEDAACLAADLVNAVVWVGEHQ